MIPTIVQISETLEISTFGLMLGLGFYAAFLLFERELKVFKKDPEIAYKLLIAIIPASIIGAKIFYVLQKIEDFSTNPTGVLLSGTGLSFYGGLILSFAVCVFVIKRMKLNFLEIADIMSPSLALGYGIGKFGSHLAGYSYGIETSSFLGVSYPNGFIPSTVSVYPITLFEVIAAFISFFILMQLRKKDFKKGILFFSAILMNTVPFFLIDFISSNEKLFSIFTLNQLLAFITTLFAVSYIFYINKKQAV